MSGATVLYSTEVLALATSLADWPLKSELLLRGSARSTLCGSTIEMGIDLDSSNQIARLGIKAHACAIGQASAALFAQSAQGLGRDDVVAALAGVDEWLCDAKAAQPDWPGLDVIAAARGYPARHGAILLPWKAALAALP